MKKTILALSFLTVGTCFVIYGHPWWGGLMVWVAIVVALDDAKPKGPIIP